MAVNMEVTMPSDRVTAKPFTGPVPNRNNTKAAIDQLRTRRAQAVADRGLINAQGARPERLPWVAPWHTLTTAQQTRAARTMELYAAMVSNLDYHIGRLLDYLDQSGLADNTYVIDHGAE